MTKSRLKNFAAVCNRNETLFVSISNFCLFYEVISKQTKYLYPPYLSNCTKAWGTVVSVITIALRICNGRLLADYSIFLIKRIVELTRTNVLWLWVLFLILYYVSPLIIVKVPFFLGGRAWQEMSCSKSREILLLMGLIFTEDHS